MIKFLCLFLVGMLNAYTCTEYPVVVRSNQSHKPQNEYLIYGSQGQLQMIVGKVKALPQSGMTDSA